MFNKKVLIIEDDDSAREVIKIHLEKEGFSILEASNDDEALKTIHQGDNIFNVSLILCDIRNFIKILKHQDFRIPVIVLTGYPNRQMAESLREMRVQEYHYKPLVETIRKFAVLGPNSKN